MAGEEIFTASAIYIFVLVSVFLVLHILNRSNQEAEGRIFSDASLVGVFGGLVLGARLMIRAFSSIDPVGGLDVLFTTALEITLWLLIVGVVVLFFRLILCVFDYIKMAISGRWESYGNEGNKGR